MRTRIVAGVICLVLVSQGQPAALAAPVSQGQPGLVLTGHSLTVRDAFDILDGKNPPVRVASWARWKMRLDRYGAQQAVRSQPVYGWNRGLGPLKDAVLDPGEQVTFQRNTLLSHAAGIGPGFADRVVRLALVIKANQMARGDEGVRPGLANRLLALVNAGVTPVMPIFGSLGTGDLQPQAAAGLVAAGENAPARYQGHEGPGPQLLAKAGISPAEFPLQEGEALPLISGSTVVTAELLDSVHRATAMADLAEGALAMFMEVTRAESGSLDARTHQARGIPEESAVAQRLRALVYRSGWMTEQGRKRVQKDAAPRVQDSVAVRAAPHILATLRHTLADAELILGREMNASTSNPLVMPRTDGPGYEFVMGGNWDGAMMGHTADTLNADIADIGVLSQELSARLLSDKWSYGLPRNLAGGKTGVNSGLVQVQTVATALVPLMQAGAFPTSVLSRPAKDGQEDHNSMAMASTLNLTANLGRLEKVLAVQYLMCAQGIDLIRGTMAGLPLGPGSELMQATIRRSVQYVAEDHYMTPDLKAVLLLVQNGGLVADVRQVEAQPYAGAA